MDCLLHLPPFHPPILVPNNLAFLPAQPPGLQQFGWKQFGLKHLELLRPTWLPAQRFPRQKFRVSALGSTHPPTFSEDLISERPIRTLLIDNYDSYTYNLYQLLSIINGVAPVVVKNDELSWEDLRQLLYEEGAFDNIVISPGPGSPTCPKDIGICMQVLEECGNIPILGVCMGHQALGYANGAQVVHAPEPVHGRLSEIEHVGCSLFNNIPSGQQSGFKVVRYHSLMLDIDSLPEDLIPTAWTVDSDNSGLLACSECFNAGDPPAAYDSLTANPKNVSCSLESSERAKHLLASGTDQLAKHAILETSKNGWADMPHRKQLISDKSGFSDMHKSLDPFPFKKSQSAEGMNSVISDRSTHDKHVKIIMAVSHRTRPHYGVQFHPESVATAYGKQILKNFRNLTIEFWQNNLHQREDKGGPCVSSRHLIGVKDGLPLNSNNARDSAMKCHSNATSPIFKTGVLRLYWEKVDGLANGTGGSEGIFCSLFGDGAAPDTFWLDSSSKEHAGARFSFMGGQGGPLWRRITYQLSNDERHCQGRGSLKIEDNKGCTEEKQLEEGFLEFLSSELQSCISQEEDYQGLPFDFCGGFIGYLGYELKAECGARFNQHKSQLPDACYFFVDRFVAVDHLNGDVYVLVLYEEVDDLAGKGKCEHSMENSNARTVNVSGFRCNGHSAAIEPGYCVSRSPLAEYENLTDFRADAASICKAAEITSSLIIPSGRGAAEAWVKEIIVKISELVECGINMAVERRFSSQLASSSLKNVESEIQFTSLKSRNQYMQDVEECLAYIRDGESYELCLTTQLRKRMRMPDALGLYLTLREMNPAPYAAWLHFGREEVCICCSSPERFLRLDQTGTLEAKPIKGTIPRGSSPVEDERLKYKLRSSEKDQAENLMIVDLLRNDLGRVCKPGSVHVPSLMAVESYATVHTLVSTVRGAKREDVTPVECVRAAFPGGSMTGAPKLRSMELLDSLESGPRGVYSGTIGFFSINSSFDLNIVIRTLVIHKGMASLGAGGAIVSLSDPEDEYEEMLLKARAPIRAVTQLESVSNLSSWEIEDGLAISART